MGLLNRIFGSRVGEGETPDPSGAPAPGENAPASKCDVSVEDRIRRGLECHQAGDLRSAEQAYHGALSEAPDHAQAHYLLGSLMGASGRLDTALEHLEQAARLDPSAAAPRSDLGNVYRMQGRLEDAEAAYRDAIAVDDELSSAHRNLADLLLSLGRIDEAIDSLSRAASLRPDDPNLHFMLADQLSSRGRYQEAMRSYQSGLSIAPQVAAAHNNLGATLRHLSRNEEARACFEDALRADPDLVDAHLNLADLLESEASVDEAIEHYSTAASLQAENVLSRRNLGRLLLARGDTDEALRCCRDVLTLDPESARSHFELGNALMAAGQRDEALERFTQAVRLDPEDADAHVNLGFVLNECKRFEEAGQRFRRALELDPKLAEAHNNLGSVMQLQGELDLAMESYRSALDLSPDQLYVHSNFLACLNYHDGVLPEDVFEHHRRWAELVESSLAPKPAVVRVPRPDSKRRLRIGYVSADFRFHSVAFFIAPIIEQHDREHFEIYCYSNVKKPDANTARLKAMSDHWRDIVSMSDAEAAAWVRRDDIDILVDLSGHTVGNRLPLFALRPATVQVSYLGYPNSTGLGAMDFRLTDESVDPPGLTDRLHSEKLVRLEGGFLCFQPLDPCPDIREPGALTDRTGITFASFNELLKVTPQTVAVWSDILNRVPESRLLIKGTTLGDEGTRRRVLDRFGEHGIDAERLKLIGRTPTLEEHLDLYNGVDVALDTYPYNGTTTTCEALWMGVPVVSRCGQVHASRVGLSLLKNVGLEDLVANDVQEYTEKAVRLAADRERRRELREELRDRMRESPLMAAEGFTRQIEAAYDDMWRRVCEAEDGRESTERHRPTSRSVVIRGGIRVRVPARLDEFTPYVLAEQEDWFEDEIQFLRRLIRPGMRCLDIGASYGLYSLTLAGRVGSDGRIWSFEPTSGTAAFLSASLGENDFRNVTLMRVALSRISGTAKLVTLADSEHNFLAEDVAGDEPFEIVDVARLDDVVREQEIRNVDFVKLDAEGAEIAILEGGEKFFERESPIVMFEFKIREVVSWELVEAVQARGYELFQLIPGLQILVPFQRDDVDGYLLNLFACSPHDATTLEQDGLALRAVSVAAPTDSENELDWLDTLRQRPYARSLANTWHASSSADTDAPPEALVRALGFHCRARDPSSPASHRFGSLRAAHDALSQPLAPGAETARLYSLARTAWELGFRRQAVAALNAICERLESGTHVLDGMPFLAVSERFENIEPGDAFEDWCLASVLEQRARLSAYSSYFQDERVLDSLELLKKTPFQGAEMERRRQLVRIRCGKQVSPEPAASLAERSADNLNPEFWGHREGQAGST